MHCGIALSAMALVMTLLATSDVAAQPQVIAHRGASGYLPEHTLAAYSLAVFQGADYIEPDLVMTRDGHLIVRHDNQLDLTTDVASHNEFAGYRTTKCVDGRQLTGWFSEDFTLAEIKQLRAIERIPDIRPANQRFDGEFEVLTLAEVLQLIKALEPIVGRRIGIYPETKHPGYFQQNSLPMEEILVKQLHAAGYQSADDPVFIQSFEIDNLKKLDVLTPLRLTQLVWIEGGPADKPDLTYEQMLSASGLERIATYADAVGVELFNAVLTPDADGRLIPENNSGLISRAHAIGLEVHGFTLRAENTFLPLAYQRGSVFSHYGELQKIAGIFAELGIDAVFSDHPDRVRKPPVFD